jgi:4-amino-4-deoxy-L-arabinose transferase-like glycosyltransferase
MLWRRDWSLALRAQPWWSLIALIVLAAPWFLAVGARNPEFPHFFFIVQHVQRYMSREGFDRYEPPWFYRAGADPWDCCRGRRCCRARCGRPGDAARGAERGTALLLVWAAFVLVFFSLSQSKLIPYIVPLIPALAPLCARSIAGMARAALGAPSGSRSRSSLLCSDCSYCSCGCCLWLRHGSRKPPGAAFWASPARSCCSRSVRRWARNGRGKGACSRPVRRPG